MLTTFRSRLLGGAIGIFILLGISVLAYIRSSLQETLTSELQKRGISIARHFAVVAADPILTENRIALQLLTLDHHQHEEDIAYLFVQTPDHRLLAHTFGKRFPPALLGINQPKPGQEFRIQELHTEQGLIYDIAAPILAGELGTVHLGMSGEAIAGEVTKVTRNSCWIVIAILAAGTLLTLIFTGAMTHQIDELQQGAEELGRGNLARRLRIVTGDEIGMLAASFNRMAENLEQTTVSRDCVQELNTTLEQTVRERTRELTDANRLLQNEVAERRQAEGEIRRLNADLERRVAERTAQLESSNRELESFCYSVSHDLLAPLRHISGYSRALMEEYGPALDRQGMHYLDRLDHAGTELGVLIDDLLQLSRVNQADIHHESVDLSILATTLADQFRELAPERAVTFTIAPAVRVVGDPSLLRLVLQNLLQNAWKYTAKAPEARIEFNTAERGGHPVYFVRDNGIGFDMAHADKLFGAFQRLVRADEFEGTGIGLATVQRIIHRHGGRVWAEGEPGKGATFFFTL